MPTRAQREAVLERAREAMARGSLSDEERVQFDEQRAWEMRGAERRRSERHRSGEPLVEGLL